MKDYLLEIGMEEIPARFLLKLRDQLAQKTAAFLEEERITFNSIETFATPRRLALRVEGLADQQTALEEEVRGPSVKVGRDAEGNLTKAALGFLKGQTGVESDLFVKNVKGTDYFFINKVAEQKTLEEVLRGVPSVLANMHFPVTMRWSDLNLEYIRPIHWILSLLEDRVIEFEFAGIEANNYSKGHRFLSNNAKIVLNHCQDYEKELEKRYVIPNFEKRQALIYQQIQSIEQEKGWLIPENDELLEEVTAIVEWPTAFHGSFEEKYLEIPQEMVITAMRDHQRYFYALDPSTKRLLPYFISVRNGNNSHLDQVIKGNQKVLRARLADGLFFYEEDLKSTLEENLSKLANLKEHFKLGTYSEKQERVKQILEQLMNRINLSNEDQRTSIRASEIYKFDLVTQAVNEFAELQGIIGGIYAKHYGEDTSVANAISQQYLPTSAGGDLPSEPAAAALSLADKLDTLIAYFKAGIIPTGSNDPYALRRQAMGLIDILLDQSWSLDLQSLLEELTSDQRDHSNDYLNDLIQFIQARIQVRLDNEAIDYDIIQAALAQKGLNPVKIKESAKHMQTLKNNKAEDFSKLIENLSRVVNLGEKVSEQVIISEELAESELEKDLIKRIQTMETRHETSDQMESLEAISPIIASYLESHMVNSDQEALRYNRYQMMYQLTEIILSLMDPRKVVHK
ncbi:glycine--tRNA ligase subunit beta [Facklamia miroungae]|uniref:Glycine--tRNA ligase beta subunit n=1 Tax=Facklamia miroungae TaxID=120956 RepID=A0A1G7R453_9LACT|nr:glycine--tRNA ligase subunit beta [Facklamia miroungae]NKZ29151.1 glycine--tRNA ligase subunit beta [Facklamia miroungae]SDG04730.1 glycyl-tRNA synthetase beta chain [Facklamia miroungae]